MTDMGAEPPFNRRNPGPPYSHMATLTIQKTTEEN
jgi:hypothetical protein